MSDQREPGAPDPAPIRDHVLAVHRAFPTGVTIVTTALAGVPFGLTCTSFASVSLDPPLVLVCVNRSAYSHDRMDRSGHLAINVLAGDQAGIARRFAESRADKFAGVDWQPGDGGAPLLAGVASSLEVVVEQRIAAGTHTVFIARVVAAAVHDRAPLVYRDGAFFDSGELSPASGRGLSSGRAPA